MRALLLVLALPSFALAAPPQSVLAPPPPQSVLADRKEQQAAPPVRSDSPGTWDVLEELNSQRRARGLQPYIWDRELTLAAGAASQYRAARQLFGHTPNDFAHLPVGATADAAGCAAYPASYGFMACACYEPGLHYAGAAYTLGADGRRFCHLFIRRASGTVVARERVRITTTAPANCPTGR